MCLAYAKAEGSGLAMPRVHIAASTAVICSRNGSKCVYQGEKLSLFSFVLPLCAPLVGWRRWNCQISGQFLSDLISVLSLKCLEVFFHFVASEEFNPCPAWVWHQVIEDRFAKIAFNQNLLFVEDGAWGEGEEIQILGKAPWMWLESHKEPFGNVGLNVSSGLSLVCDI